MNFNRKEHNRFIQYLDSTAEKNPLLWLPCVLIISVVLIAKHIAEYAKIAYLHRNTERLVVGKPHLERKPFFLRAVAVTVTAAFSLMLVPVNSFAAFDEEYGSITEQVFFDDVTETEEITEPEEPTVPEETTEPEETTVPEEPTVPEETTEPEETTVPEEPTVPEETTEPEEATEPDEPSVPEEITEPEEVTFPEEAEFPEEEIFLNEGISPLDDHEHTYHRWEQTENEHWRICTICNKEFNRAMHDYAITVINPTKTSTGRKTFTCTICGYSYFKTLPMVSHDHAFDNYRWVTDTDSHWHICINPDCEAVGDFAVHSFGEWYNDVWYHWRQCTVCGYTSRRTQHSFGAWQTDNDNNHWRICVSCNYKETISHNFVLKSNTTNHWQECSTCGRKKEEEPHTMSDELQWNNSAHWQGGCTVCQYSTAETSLHNKSWENTGDGDGDTHWQVCSECGWSTSPSTHNFIWIRREDEHWRQCACGLIKEQGEHDFNDLVYKSNESEHWHECIDCGWKINVAAHTPDYDTWYGDGDSHWRECSECGHDVEKVKHDYKRYHDEVTHWDFCDECGRKDHEAFHSYLEPTYTYDKDGVTPIKIFECADCDYSYTVPVWHEHTFFDKLGYNELGHWYDCQYCDGKINSAHHTYSVKVTLEPTETETGTRVYTCTVCDYTYEETIPELGHEHTFGREWRNNESDHWRECTGCGEKTDIAPHVFDGGRLEQGSMLYTCTICGYIIKTELPPVSEPAPEPPAPAPVQAVQEPLRLPYITNVPTIKGWVNIAEYINASPDEVIIPITMNGEVNLPADIAECIMNRAVTLRINMDGIPVWTINGLDVTDPVTVNMRVSEHKNQIPASAFDGIISELQPKEYRLHHSGTFGYRALLTLNIGNNYNDYYASLYHYNSKTKQLEFVDESLVENGYVTFALTHASYYAVAFNSIAMYDNVSASAGVFESSVPIETSAIPETNGVAIPAVKLPQIMKHSNKKRRYRVLKKRRLDDLVFVF